MIIINLMFWHGDKAQAMELARLVADLEPKFRDDFTFMFTARFDTDFDEETIKYVEQKFPVLRYKTKRKATGWPNGPNQMVGCSYEFIVEGWKRGGLRNTTAIFFMEADCVPLRFGWLDEIKAEFEGCGKKVLGAWLTSGDASCNNHINGNCVVAIDFFKKCTGMIHPPSRGGWDATLAFAICPNGAPSKLIWSDYKLGSKDNPWRGDDYLWETKKYPSSKNPLHGHELKPCYFHGIKTMQGIQAVRKRLFDEPKNQAVG